MIELGNKLTVKVSCLHLLVGRELSGSLWRSKNHRLVLRFRVFLRFFLQLLQGMCINWQVTLLNDRWVGGFVNHHRFLLGDEVLLEEELLIEGLVLLNQIVKPSSVHALSIAQRGIFNWGATLLLPAMIVVKDGGP